jgi:hypothetical protein
VEKGNERTHVFREQRDQLPKFLLLKKACADVLLGEETDDRDLVRR